MGVFFMANKGQKFKKYDLEFKLQVLEAYDNGSSAGYLAKKYDVPEDTIYTWDRIRKKNGSLNIVPKGRPRKIQDNNYKERYDILKKFQDFLVKQEQKKK